MNPPAEPGTQTIAVVEDDQSIRELLELYLSGQGYAVAAAGSAGEASRTIDSSGADLVVLDLMLPDGSGFDVLKELRATSQIPVVILTARDAEQDKILGLELGADDYVTKPFSPGELVARVRAVLRRVSHEAGESSAVRAGGVEVNPEERVARAGGRVLELTPKEFELLHYLLLNRGIALSRERLLEEVWGYTFYGEARTVDAHIRQVRKKLAEYSPLVQTVWGVGYKLDPSAKVPEDDADEDDADGTDADEIDNVADEGEPDGSVSDDDVAGHGHVVESGSGEGRSESEAGTG